MYRVPPKSFPFFYLQISGIFGIFGIFGQKANFVYFWNRVMYGMLESLLKIELVCQDGAT